MTVDRKNLKTTYMNAFSEDIKSNHFLVIDALDEMQNFVKDIEQCVMAYLDCADETQERLLKLAATAALNNFVQSFMDIVDAMGLVDSSACISLNRYIRAILSSDINFSADAKEILSYLITRNDIAHEYFRFNTLAEENINKFISYTDGFNDIYHACKEYCALNGLLEEVIR